MTDVKLIIYRTWTERFEELDGRKVRHRQRAQLLHGLATELDLTVKDWGETDADYPREFVEIIVALGTAGVFTALVAAFQSWLARDKIKEVEIKTADGTVVKLSGATVRDIEAIADKLGLKAENRAPKQAQSAL